MNIVSGAMSVVDLVRMTYMVSLAINIKTSESLTPVKRVDCAPRKAVSSLNAAAIAFERSPLRCFVECHSLSFTSTG